MSIGEIIALVGLIMANITALIISYNKTTSWVKVKLKELDMKIEANKTEYDNHVRWGEDQQNRNLDRFNMVETDNKLEHKEIMVKMDTIINQLNKFMLEIIGKINK